LLESCGIIVVGGAEEKASCVVDATEVAADETDPFDQYEEAVEAADIIECAGEGG